MVETFCGIPPAVVNATLCRATKPQSHCAHSAGIFNIAYFLNHIFTAAITMKTAKPRRRARPLNC
jgi:hypothetical protein